MMANFTITTTLNPNDNSLRVQITNELLSSEDVSNFLTKIIAEIDNKKLIPDFQRKESGYDEIIIENVLKL